MSKYGNKERNAAPSQLRVVIVGGGVAGLTLANALEQSGIDYVLLERRDTVAPQIGASIGIFPSGARILDQLGAWNEVNRVSEPLQLFYTRNSKGRLMIPPDESNLLVSTRTGYLISWCERQHLLRILYQNLRDPSKILTSKGVLDIKHDTDGVTVVCEDGSSFRGDLVVGTDGVFSKTRNKIWELAQSSHPELVREDRDSLIAEYNCLFGIAKGVTHPDLVPGEVDTCYNSHRCALTVVAEGGKMYWFAQERLSKTHRLGDIPRYTAKDAEEFIARNRDIVIRPGPNGLTVGDLWKHTVSASLVAIEEAKFKLWHWGRIACAGDSIHKATPNLGIGGNLAIESAAVLANGIKLLADTSAAFSRHPTREEIERMLSEYQKERELRAASAVDASGTLARAQNINGPMAQFLVNFAMPHLTEFLPVLMSNIVIGAAKLDFLPLPLVSLTGTQPFNPKQGDGFRESKLRRMLVGLPLVVLAVAALFTMNSLPSLDWARALRDSGRLELDSGSVPIRRTLYHISWIDNLISLVNIYFFPSIYGTDAASRRQVISFLTDGTVLLTIWICESVRRANMLTIMQWPLLFALPAQFISIAFVAPLYSYLHYILSPIENFSALDQRLTRVRWTYASLPAVLATYLIPFYLAYGVPFQLLPFSFFSFDGDDEKEGGGGGTRAVEVQQLVLFFWQLYPLWLSAALWGISRLFRDTTATDKLMPGRVRCDLPVMRWYIGFASALAAGVWIWAWAGGEGLGIRRVFIPSGLPSSMDSLSAFTGELLRWDYIYSFGAQLLWLGYLFSDLAQAGMLREGWWRVIGLGVVSVLLVGPGATLGLGWLLREHILATRRHGSALTPESVGRLHGVAS